MKVDALVVGADIAFVNKVLKGLFETQEFVTNWRFGCLSNHANGKSVELWFHKVFLDALLNSGEYDFQDLLYWNGCEWSDAAKKVKEPAPLKKIKEVL